MLTAIKTYFQVITRSKMQWGHVGEMVTYSMDTIDLVFADGKIRSYLHSEVEPFNVMAKLELI